MKKIILPENTVYEFSKEGCGKKRYFNVSKRNPLGFYVEFVRNKKDEQPQRTFIRYGDIENMIDAMLEIQREWKKSKEI